MPCQKCKKYESFIRKMIVEFSAYNENKTALYYKGQCVKVLEQTAERRLPSHSPQLHKP